MNLTLLQSFVALAEAGSFQAAAERIGIAQPTLSQHLKKLESDLGAELVSRNHSGSRLTPAGARFLPHAQQVLASATRARDAALSDTLKIGCSGNIASYFMPQNLAAFLATQDTKMLWEVVSAPNPKIAEMLLTGEVDLAAMEWPLSHAAVSAKAWAREEMVIILPPDHAFATRSEITFEELKTLRILGGERGTGTGTLLNDALGPQAAELNTVGNLGSTEAVKRAVAAGLGASIVLARSVLSEVASGDLAICRLKGKALTKPFYLAILKDSAAAVPAARMLDFLIPEPA
ncbi:DNA-binding transcriptional regulator, LysR family [Roseovarius litoreus]|jgi:DNA-binding transcriptional LysR family regulator|uniref:DNA-binding transcriptional regulator, LysR family n=1 Tax=Roseovarius litoreus TaxID=1155722 RepID=A0A1M7B270_9RHOB|nr:LysR family transcriptional regulator [Roseovarius litoreus]SHL49031.1 DNA-binding transcriptional regulator, LysR family [Roseovarius litoreus]